MEGSPVAGSHLPLSISFSVSPCLCGVNSLMKKAAIAGRRQEPSVVGRSTIATPSSSSKSASITLMISLFLVGTTFPM